MDPTRPPHIGVLLDNLPEYVFWLGAAAISRSVVVGINSTYRGDQLAQLVRHTDCQMIVTSADQRQLLTGLDLGPASDQIVEIDAGEYDGSTFARRGGHREPDAGRRRPVLADLHVWLHRCAQGGPLHPGTLRPDRDPRGNGDEPLLAGRRLLALALLPLQLALHRVGLIAGGRCSHRLSPEVLGASNTLDDIRRFNATMMTYTGKVLNYILAVPEKEDDANTGLRLAIGNEASGRDIVEFAQRFGCDVRDSYGATEGIIIIRRDPTMPAGALGRAADSVKVMNPDTGEECPPAEVGANGRVDQPAPGGRGDRRDRALQRVRGLLQE